MGFFQKLVNKARVKSPFIFHFNSGSCNGCDIEIIAALMPRIDIERFGMKLVGSPRHADIMLVTGPVSHQIAPRLKRIYDQMAEPKFVVAVGSCACSGGAFRGGYATLGGVDQVIPVSAYIPGCAPKPSAIAYGAYKLLEHLSEVWDLVESTSIKKVPIRKHKRKADFLPHDRDPDEDDMEPPPDSVIQELFATNGDESKNRPVIPEDDPSMGTWKESKKDE